MLNFRKLKQDFSSGVLSEGQTLFQEEGVISAKILELDGNVVKVGASIRGTYDNLYEGKVEIDRQGSELVDSDCDCSYRFDCTHLAALLFYLEAHLDELLVAYSSELGEDEDGGEVDEELTATIETAKAKASVKRGRTYERELLAEYACSGALLGGSLFFLPEADHKLDRAELAIIITPQVEKAIAANKGIEISTALRLPSRSKPLHIPNVREFFEAVRYGEPIWLAGKRYFFAPESFGEQGCQVLNCILDTARFSQKSDEKAQKIAVLEPKVYGMLLAHTYDLVMQELGGTGYVVRDGEKLAMPCIFDGSLEKPLSFSPSPVSLRFVIESIETPQPKLFLRPTVVLDEGVMNSNEVSLIECVKPGLLFDGTYYRFHSKIKRLHLRDLPALRDMTIPEPLFGTFVENSLPKLMRYADVANQEALSNVATLPFVGELKARCHIEYLDGELEATLFFIYDDIEVPASLNKLKGNEAALFVGDDGTLARNLVEERTLLEALFDGFIYNVEQGSYVAKSERKIVDFMTEIVPAYSEQVTFECPQNLLDQFLYDETLFTLKLTEAAQVDSYSVNLTVDGHLKGTSLDRIWDAIASKRNYIELDPPNASGRGRKGLASRARKFLVLDLERVKPVVQLFDEIGLKALDNSTTDRPLWSLASVQTSFIKGLPVKVSMSTKLKEIQKQILGDKQLALTPMPPAVKADLHPYQVEGVNWLERLRKMHLSGILADDMGLGKTVQAITALTQYIEAGEPGPSLVVCPTSLVYNWEAELHRFNPNIRVLVVDGLPSQRKKLIEKVDKHDVVITSYSLLQKDVDGYGATQFGYLILDEAQHIKNRTTRNAKSVKQLKACHRLILTGTPIENSLEELWSLFDFLMPGLLSSYDRFVERYIRQMAQSAKPTTELLSRKVAPFILRRMKADVLADLPPVTETVYYCQLSKTQRELYQSYAASAREELSRLVKKEGFDRVQIHVLATLTRLKQICCHPAIFAKESVEEGDSAKYDMMLELLHTLIEGKHKTVIFSQYTQMLKIMRDDLERLGIGFAYLDGSTKNRMDVVRSFNEDPRILVFLVSLKAGGTGLNLTGADAVVHFDLWWNPAVQEQATDRVHRLGQDKPVSSLKLVTLGTIEEKVLELQKRKKGLVKQVVSSDDEVVSKLTWEEVLELLQV